jgi:hypothetical protein
MMYYLAQFITNPNKVNISGDKGTLTHILNIIFTIMGALAVLMIIIAGFRYVISDGEPNKVAEIKRSIIYAVVGLIVIASAAAAVNFILDKAG